MLISLLVLGCESEPEEVPLPTFEPVAVGFGFDGVVTSDGTLSGYGVEDQTYAPSVTIQFVSALFADAEDATTRELESCVAVTTFEPPPLVPPEQIPTVGDVPLFVSYDTTLVLEATSCIGRADPAVWGDEAEGLLDPFDGAHLGVGIGPMTDALRATWEAEILDDVGSSMLALWIAMDDAEGVWVASDLTTSIAFGWDEATGDLATETDLDGNVNLVPLKVDDLTPESARPAMYLQSYPAVYRDLELFDLENLSD